MEDKFQLCVKSFSGSIHLSTIYFHALYNVLPYSSLRIYSTMQKRTQLKALGIQAEPVLLEPSGMIIIKIKEPVLLPWAVERALWQIGPRTCISLGTRKACKYLLRISYHPVSERNSRDPGTPDGRIFIAQLLLNISNRI